MRLLGVVLAGGRSSRFGSDKALALYRGVALLDHAVAALEPLVAEVAVAGRTHPGLRTIADSPAPGLGPLGGLNGALALAAAEGFDAVLSVPCDVPDLDSVLPLLLDDGGPATFADLPVCGLWPARLSEALAVRLRTGSERSMRGWAASCGARVLPGPGLAGVNTPADLARLAPPTNRVLST